MTREEDCGETTGMFGSRRICLCRSFGVAECVAHGATLLTRVGTELHRERRRTFDIPNMRQQPNTDMECVAHETSATLLARVGASCTENGAPLSTYPTRSSSQTQIRHAALQVWRAMATSHTALYPCRWHPFHADRKSYLRNKKGNICLFALIVLDISSHQANEGSHLFDGEGTPLSGHDIDS